MVGVAAQYPTTECWRQELMRIISFNCNGLRARLHQIKALAEKKADIVCLQEIKVHSDQFPTEQVQQQGFEFCEHHGQKAYHGVATS